MSSSPSDAQKYAQRAAEREQRFKEEKKRIEEKIQESYSAQREQHEQELEKKREVSRKIAETKKEELTKLRSKLVDGSLLIISGNFSQAQEIADLQAQLDAATKERIEMRSAEGRLEVEKRKEELEKIQKELEAQLAQRKEQLHASSEIIKNAEKLRQECLNRLRDDRKKELEEMNAKTLEMNQKLHETKIAGEERLQMLDEKRNEEQKKQLLKKEGIILNGISNSAALSSSLALEDGFELFKQQCNGLRNRHRNFCIEYDSIEPTLLKVHERMKTNKKFPDCDMDGLIGALRVFNEQATSFNPEGSTAEDSFQEKIATVIEILRNLRANINKIQSKIEDVEDGVAEDSSAGIGEWLCNIESNMKEMGMLIQEFNVIGVDKLQETLAIQMDAAQSSRRHHAIEGGPPAYENPKKVKPAAITASE